MKEKYFCTLSEEFHIGMRSEIEDVGLYFRQVRYYAIIAAILLSYMYYGDSSGKKIIVSMAYRINMSYRCN